MKYILDVLICKFSLENLIFVTLAGCRYAFVFLGMNKYNHIPHRIKCYYKRGLIKIIDTEISLPFIMSEFIYDIPIAQFYPRSYGVMEPHFEACDHLSHMLKLKTRYLRLHSKLLK